MENPFLTWLVGWVCGLASDCLKVWCRRRILRWLDPDPVPDPPAEPPAEEPAPADPPELPPLIDHLYRTVARYRRGGRP